MRSLYADVCGTAGKIRLALNSLKNNIMNGDRSPSPNDDSGGGNWSLKPLTKIQAMRLEARQENVWVTPSSRDRGGDESRKSPSSAWGTKKSGTSPIVGPPKTETGSGLGLNGVKPTDVDVEAPILTRRKSTPHFEKEEENVVPTSVLTSGSATLQRNNSNDKKSNKSSFSSNTPLLSSPPLNNLFGSPAISGKFLKKEGSTTRSRPFSVTYEDATLSTTSRYVIN